MVSVIVFILLILRHEPRQIQTTAYSRRVPSVYHAQFDLQTSYRSLHSSNEPGELSQ